MDLDGFEILKKMQKSLRWNPSLSSLPFFLKELKGADSS